MVYLQFFNLFFLLLILGLEPYVLNNDGLTSLFMLKMRQNLSFRLVKVSVTNRDNTVY